MTSAVPMDSLVRLIPREQAASCLSRRSDEGRVCREGREGWAVLSISRERLSGMATENGSPRTYWRP